MNAALLIDVASSVWADYQPASCMPAGCYCEPVHAGIIRQPVNAASSLSFVLAALWVLTRRGRTRPPAPSGAPLSPRRFQALFAMILAGIGIASAIFHASLILTAQFFDIVGIYALGTLLVTDAAGRALAASPRVLAAGAAAVLTALALLSLTSPGTGVVGTAALIGGLTALEVRYRRRTGYRPPRRPLLSGLAVLGVAYGLSELDATGVFCRPDSWVQGHALWHVLAAGATTLLFRYCCPTGTDIRAVQQRRPDAQVADPNRKAA